MTRHEATSGGRASGAQEDSGASLSMERELDAIERGLAGARVDPDLEAVARVVRELRDARPKPSEGFAADLDERARDGFADPAGSSIFERLQQRLAGARPVRVLAPVGAVATLAVVVSVAVIQSGDLDGGPRDAVLEGPGDAAFEEGAPAPGGTGLSTGAGGGLSDVDAGPDAGGAQSEATDAGAARSGVAIDARAARPGVAASAAKVSPSAARDLAAPGPRGELFVLPPVPGPPDGLAPGRRNRAVEHSGSLELSTGAEEFPGVTDGVIGVTDRYRGFVVSSQESSAGDTARASFELAIPSQRLQQALADLSALAHVEARTEGSLDITSPTVSARAQLSDARAEVASLRRQLAVADSADETQEIRSRLGIARSQSAAAKAEVQRLALRARYATLSVTVAADGSGDGSWGVEEALDDINDAFSTAAGMALVTLAILFPFALVVGVGAVVRHRWVRRSREQALDEG